MHKESAVNLKTLPKVNSATERAFSGTTCFFCSCAGCATICPHCLNDLAFNDNACPACAKPGASSRLCASCLSHPWPFISRANTLFQYRYPANHLIQHLKFRQKVGIASALGKMLVSLLPGDTPDCIIPVPLHTGRLISRGYNQSAELARPLSRLLGVKLDLASCRRIRATTPQMGLPAKKRQKNVHNAFSVLPNTHYGHVLIVDDVITTGSTVNELARMLHHAGASKIDVVACARAS